MTTSVRVSRSLGVCPRCKGTGRSRQFNRRPKYSDAVYRRVVALWDRGLSLRAIAEKLDLKHPQTVKNILETR